MPVRIELSEVDSIIDVRWRVLRSPRPRETAQYAEDEWPDTFHLAAIAGGDVVGCATFFPEDLDDEPAWRFRGMAVDEHHRDQGVGGQLLQRGVAEVKDRGGSLVWCNGRTAASRFYERHSFERRGEEFVIVPSGPHFIFARHL
jgi:predicted N-acetyltransferase YhbS